MPIALGLASTGKSPKNRPRDVFRPYRGSGGRVLVQAVNWSQTAAVVRGNVPVICHRKGRLAWGTKRLRRLPERERSDCWGTAKVTVVSLLSCDLLSLSVSERSDAPISLVGPLASH